MFPDAVTAAAATPATARGTRAMDRRLADLGRRGDGSTCSGGSGSSRIGGNASMRLAAARAGRAFPTGELISRSLVA